MEDKKIGTIKLIRDFFAPVTMNEIKDLNATDRAELGSAIARSQGLTQAQVGFDLVTY